MIELIERRRHVYADGSQRLVLGRRRLALGVRARTRVTELHFRLEHARARADAPGDERLGQNAVALSLTDTANTTSQ